MAETVKQPTLTPPADWNCEVLGVRLFVEETNHGLEAVKKLLYENEVKLEWHEGGAWSAIAVWPAWRLPCGAMHSVGIGDATRSTYPSHGGRFDPPQRVRAGRTRLWFPEGAWGFMDVMLRGTDLVRHCYTKVPGTVLSICLNGLSEVRES